MELDKRVTVAVVILTLAPFAIWAFDLPVWIIAVVGNIVVSYVISGFIYVVLSAVGFGSLEGKSIFGVVSAMAFCRFHNQPLDFLIPPKVPSGNQLGMCT